MGPVIGGGILKTRVNGFEVYYEDSGKGVPVVFIHGMGGDSSEWSSFMPEFSKVIRCIAIDLRGHGKSEKPAQPYTQDMFAGDIAALLDILEIDKAYYCGISMGGFIAMKSALNYPEKVTGLILIDTAARIPAKSIEVATKWSKAAEKGLKAYIEAEIRDLFHPMFTRRHKDEVEVFAESMRTRERVVETLQRIEQGYAQKPYDLTKELRNIKVPTLIIHGRDDKVVSYEEAVLTHEEIPNSQLALIPFVGHASILERKDFFIDLLLYFVEESEKLRGEH